jgi:hypothetical protein
MLQPTDIVGATFWLISIAMVASAAFFFLERRRVADRWKTSVTVAGVVTLVSAIHYFYLREVWATTGAAATVFRFVDALSTVAAQMAMDEMQEERGKYVKAVKSLVEHALTQNGLELEAVSLTGLDQTDISLFNPSNVFDAEGLTRLTGQIESRKKLRNDIEQDTLIQIRDKNLETEKLSLEIEKESQ